jgi:signal transduction histidine kinase
VRAYWRRRPGAGPQYCEAVILHKNGQRRNIEFSVKVSQTRRAARLHHRGDVSQRVRAVEQLRSSQDQLRRLSAHLEEARTRRGTIAREIHDELGQARPG